MSRRAAAVQQGGRREVRGTAVTRGVKEARAAPPLPSNAATLAPTPAATVATGSREQEAGGRGQGGRK